MTLKLIDATYCNFKVRLTACLGLFLGFSLNCRANIFVPITLQEQAEKSNVIVIGKINQIQSYQCKKNICTEVEVKIDQSIGLNYVSETLKFYLNGGTMRDKTQFFHGNPTLKTDETFAIFLKYEDAGFFTPLNLALSKYKLTKEAHQVVLINEVFPFNEEMGSFPIEKFKEVISDVKSKSWITHNQQTLNKYLNENHSNQRSLASIEEESQNQLGYFEHLNLFLLFLFLLFIARSIQKKSTHRG